MGYRCGVCNIDFPNVKKLVEHNVTVHNSPFIDGDEKLIQLSKEIATKTNNAEVIKILSDAGY